MNTCTCTLKVASCYKNLFLQDNDLESSGLKYPEVEFQDRLKLRRIFLCYSLKVFRVYIKRGHGHLFGSTNVWLLLTAVPFRTVIEDRQTRVPVCSPNCYGRLTLLLRYKGWAHNHQCDHRNVSKQWHVAHKPPVQDALSTHTCLVFCVVWRPRSRNNWSSRRLASWRASRLLTLLLPNEIIIVATAERRSRQSAQTTPPTLTRPYLCATLNYALAISPPLSLPINNFAVGSPRRTLNGTRGLQCWVAGGEERRGSRYSLRSEVTAETRGEANEIGMVGVRGRRGGVNRLMW